MGSGFHNFHNLVISKGSGYILMMRKRLHNVHKYLFTLKPDPRAYQSYESYESLTPLILFIVNNAGSLALFRDERL